MKKFLVLLVVLVLAALLVLGCQKASPTGYASYSQQDQQQPYVGGGCGVSPVSDSGEAPLQVSEPSLAA
jgi:ABC-type oligopeptide transport system substrate-binding subunit